MRMKGNPQGLSSLAGETVRPESEATSLREKRSIRSRKISAKPAYRREAAGIRHSA